MINEIVQGISLRKKMKGSSLRLVNGYKRLKKNFQIARNSSFRSSEINLIMLLPETRSPMKKWKKSKGAKRAIWINYGRSMRKIKKLLKNK